MCVPVWYALALKSNNFFTGNQLFRNKLVMECWIPLKKYPSEGFAAG